MTTGESALCLDEEVVMSRITTFISDKLEPEYTKELRE
jgi:hypothetical protein